MNKYSPTPKSFNTFLYTKSKFFGTVTIKKKVKMKTEEVLPLKRIASILSIALVGCSFSASSQQNAYRFFLEPVDGHIIVAIQTTEPLPCIGYTIRNRVQWEEDTAVVILNGFVRPIPCVEGFGPASARIEVARELKKAFYIKFREDTSSDLWKISPAESGFQAMPVQSTFTSYSK